MKTDQDIHPRVPTWLEQLAHNSLHLDGQESTHAGAPGVTEDFGTEKHNSSAGDHDSSGPKDTGGKLPCAIDSGPEPPHNLPVAAKVSPISLEIGVPSLSSIAGNRPLWLDREHGCGSSIQALNAFGLHSNPFYRPFIKQPGNEALSKAGTDFCPTRLQYQHTPCTSAEGPKPIPALLAGQLVFDANMLPVPTRKLRKKTKTERQASRTLRKSGGACPAHKAARKAVNSTSAKATISPCMLTVTVSADALAGKTQLIHEDLLQKKQHIEMDSMDQ